MLPIGELWTVLGRIACVAWTRPIPTDVARFVVCGPFCLCVCVSAQIHSRALQKWRYRSTCPLEPDLRGPDELWGR